MGIVVFKDDVETIVSGKMKESMKNYNNSSAGGVKETWDVLQKDVKCCGKNFQVEDIYQTGCFATFKANILDNSDMAIGCGVGIGILIFLGVLIGCCQARTMKERNSYA